MVNIPSGPQDITTAWLSLVLDRTVTSMDVQFLEGGVLSDAYKARNIAYADTDPEPRSLVIKIANRIKDLRDFGMMANAYNKEFNFFRDLSSGVPVGVPRLYGCGTDGSAGAEFFFIVMEDLTTHSKVFDQVSDPPDAAYARKLALDVARMHAQYWNAEILRESWIGDPDGRYVFSFDPLARLAGQSLDTFLSLYQQMFGFGFFTQGDFAAVEAMTRTLCGPRSIDIINAMQDILSSRPKTLLHGDMRADNVFRTDPQSGRSVEDSRLTFIDWQLLHAGPPGPEFSQAWFSSLEPEVRVQDAAILREYHDSLVSLRPEAASYSYEMLLEDYALGCIYWYLALIALGCGAFPAFDKPEGARSKQLWGNGLRRILHALRDRDCPALVDRIVRGLP